MIIIIIIIIIVIAVVVMITAKHEPRAPTMPWSNPLELVVSEISFSISSNCLWEAACWPGLA